MGVSSVIVTCGPVNSCFIISHKNKYNTLKCTLHASNLFNCLLNSVHVCTIRKSCHLKKKNS